MQTALKLIWGLARGWTEEQSRCDGIYHRNRPYGIYQGVILLVYAKLNEIIMLAIPQEPK